MDKIKQPIIIMGMHRSGTTMIAKILEDLGLFIGWELDMHKEAMFFLRRNEKILKAFNGGWDNPTVIDHLFSHAGMIEMLTNSLRKDLNSVTIFSYLGPRLFGKYRSVFRLDREWGWKDPRNTFLLPLWLKIFPGARIIHIYRNGIDVAASLSFREENWFQIITKEKNIKEVVETEILQFKERGSLFYLKDFIRLYIRRLDPLSKYEDLRIHPCISMDTGFDLWCTYIERAFSLFQTIPNEVFNIRYEDFLESPKEAIIDLQKYCNLTTEDENIVKISDSVKSDRLFAFLNNDDLIGFYEKNKENYWMKTLDYNNIC